MVRLETPTAPTTLPDPPGALDAGPGRWWPAPVALSVLAVIFFWRITLAGEVVFWGTPLLQFYPWRSLAIAAYRAGELPLWNPWSDFGAPLAANLQTAAFSPLNLIYLLMPVETAMGWTIVLHVALAGVCMYWCGRVFGLSGWGARIAALAFMFSGFVIARAGFLSMVAAAPWFPAVMAATEMHLRAVSTGKDRAWTAAVLAGSVGMLLVAGHIQLAFYTLVAAGSCALVRAWQLAADQEAVPAVVPARAVRRARRVGNLLLPVAAAVLLGCGLAAVQLLPTAELTAYSARRDGPGYDYAMNYSLYPFQVAQVIAPDLFGSPVTGDYRGPGNYWEGTSYIGAVTLLLALIGARFSAQPARPFLLALTAAAWLLALGRHTPVYPWVFEHLPGFGLFQAPARLLFWWTLAGSLLAGMGLDVLRTRAGDPRLRRWTALPIGAAAGIGCGAVAALLVAGPSGVAGSSLLALTKAAVLLIAGAVLLRAGNRLGPRWPAAVAALLTADLFLFGHALNPTTSPDLYRAHVAPIVTPSGDLPARIFIKEQDFEQRFGTVFGFRTFGSSLAADLLPLRASLYPNLGVLAGVPDAFNYDPLKLDRARQLRQTAERATDSMPLLRMMGVGTMLDEKGQATPVALPPLPRAYLAQQVVPATGREHAQRLLAATDPLTTAVIEGLPPRLHEGSALTGPARVLSITGNRGAVGAVEVEATGDAVLIVTESFYPGWTARLDGSAVPVYPANLAFRAVVVPAGRHRVEFAYEPLSVAVGLGVSGCSLLVLAALGGWAVFARRGRGAHA